MAALFSTRLASAPFPGAARFGIRDSGDAVRIRWICALPLSQTRMWRFRSAEADSHVLHFERLPRRLPASIRAEKPPAMPALVADVVFAQQKRKAPELISKVSRARVTAPTRDPVGMALLLMTARDSMEEKGLAASTRAHYLSADRYFVAFCLEMEIDYYRFGMAEWCRAGLQPPILSGASQAPPRRERRSLSPRRTRVQPFRSRRAPTRA